jgi:hypothetical protein
MKTTEKQNIIALALKKAWQKGFFIQNTDGAKQSLRLRCIFYARIGLMHLFVMHF